MFNREEMKVSASGFRFMVTAATVCAVLTFVGCASSSGRGPLDLSDQKVVQRLRMHYGSSWTVVDDSTDPASRGEDINELYAKYFTNREVRVNVDEVTLADADFRVPMYLLNDGLMCGDVSGMTNFVSPCVNNDRKTVDPAGDPALEKCLEVPRPSTNLIGSFRAETTKDGQEAFRNYCLHVVVLEQKVLPEGAGLWRSSPTRIETDRIRVAVLREDGTGDSGPGTLVGGPRQQFGRAPAD